MKHYRPENTIIICVFVFLLLLPLTRIADFDVFFHLRLGEHLWEKKALYTLDEFSHTTAGLPQNTGEWLSNTVLYAAYRPLGFMGLGIMKSLMFLALMYFTYRTFRLLHEKEYIVPAAISLIALAYALRFRLDLRPYLYTYLFISMFLFILLRRRRGGGGLYWLPLLQVLWSNAHGGDILGPMLMGLFLLSEAARLRRVPMGTLLPTALVLAASWLNPQDLTEGIAMVSMNPISGSGARELGEWQPLTAELLWGHGMRYTLGYQVLLAGAAAFLISEAAKKRFDVFLICLFTAALVYPIRHVRLIPVASILLAPMFYDFLRDLFSLMPGEKRIRLPIALSLCACIAYLTVFSVIRSDYYSFGFGPKEGVFPDAALEFLDRNGIEGNAFNTVTMGSYMLWRAPHRKTFMDGRLVPSREVNSHYDGAIRDMEGFRELEERYGINYALLDYNPKSRWRFPAHLNAAADWTPVFWDNAAVVYLKDNERNREVIRKRGYKLLRPYFNDFSYLDRHLGLKGETVLKQMDEDIARNPENQEAHLAKAYAAYYLGLRETALEELRTALGLEPDTAFEHISMAQLLLESGEDGEAEGHLRQALRLEPHNRAAGELIRRLGH
jgi:hypothetical protein